jgi:hypothetical protein
MRVVIADVTNRGCPIEQGCIVCSLFHCLPILLLGPVPAAIAPCDESVSRPEFDVTKATAREVWAQVAATNGVWLQPTAKNLSYAVLGRLIDADTPKPGIASHVWISGTLARWQMDAPKAGWDDEDLSYLLVLTGDSEQYLEAPLQEMIRKPKKARDLSSSFAVFSPVREPVGGYPARVARYVSRPTALFHILLSACTVDNFSSHVTRRSVVSISPKLHSVFRVYQGLRGNCTCW